MNKSILVVASAALMTVCSTAPEQKAIVEKEFIASDGIVRLDSRFDEIVPKDVRIEKLAGGFTFIEGLYGAPRAFCGLAMLSGTSGRQWSPNGTVTEILKPGGYDGTSLPIRRMDSRNRLTVDWSAEQKATVHGNHSFLYTSTGANTS